MEILLLIARLILTIVFGVAGVAKLFDRFGSEKAIVNFGLPQNLAKPLAVLLPLAEIATAFFLLPLATAWLGAIAATVLLLAFVVGIIYNLLRGNAPDCHCFGQIHSESIGWSVLIRNLVLTAVAIFIVTAGTENAGVSAFGWLAELSTGERMQLVFNLIFVAFLGLICYGIKSILKNQIVFQRQLEILELTAIENGGDQREVKRENVRRPAPGLPVGAIAPDFTAPDLTGRKFSLEHLLMRGKPILLIFVSSSCSPCQALLPSVERWQAEFGSHLTITFLSSGTAAENTEKFGRVVGFATVLRQDDREISKLFRSEWTPGAILINADGTIGSVLATGDAEIFGLIDKIKPILTTAIAANGNGHRAQNIFVQPIREARTPVIGQIAPDFTLPNLDGEKISLSNFRGMKTVLLFWRATCGYCQQLNERLKTWETINDEFNLVILAANEPEIERAREFKSTVLIETDLEVQRKFDFDGTPSAVVIDADGTIASDVASGEEDVFALVGDYRKTNF